MVHIKDVGTCPDSCFPLVLPGSGHEEALSRFTLKKLLLLVCFLDKAKEARLIEHDPCLFCMDAEFKVQLSTSVPMSKHFVI